MENEINNFKPKYRLTLVERILLHAGEALCAALAGVFLGFCVLNIMIASGL